ncbi:MAG: P-type conjugative transfer protein TrbG [Succinivibrio dextrinosolvens]|nr:P-type conjugative transfer protein TrbG [Succinivibrio dextrinosolvens]
MKNKYKFLTVSLAAMLAMPVFADADPNENASGLNNTDASSSVNSFQKTKPINNYSLEDYAFEGAKAPEFTLQQQKTLEKVKNFKTDKRRNTSFVNGRGDVIFNYGAQQPNIVCSVMNVVDLELEPGESINSVNIGDPSRWNVEPAVSGYGETQTQHVLIKPLDVGLRTNMLIATDRRAYRVDLISTETQYYPHVSFSYPEKLAAQFAAKQLVEKQERDKKSITTDPATGSKTYLGDLNFKYTVTGNVSWKPVRVYDDGRKTIIEMPSTLEYAKAPSLMLLAEKGGMFSDEKTEIINYRLQENRYVVDGIFETAILTMGLDKNQQRVVIKRNK